MTYKSLMVKKLHNVQKRLMEKEIKSESLEDLLPLIFEECLKENMMFYFNFIENSCVLNLCDIEQENYELRIRCHHDSVVIDYNDFKKTVLENAFLLTSNKHAINEDPASVEASSELSLISGDKPVPKAIRNAIDTINSKGIPVTVEAIRNHLPLGQMSTSNRMECNKYLKEMEGS